MDPDGDAVYRGSDNCGMITPYVSDATNRCCAERARAYWLGGDVFVRDRVDTDFDMCRQATHESTNIDVLDVYFGVRDTLSTPYLHTPLRWGGGQAYGRGYR